MLSILYLVVSRPNWYIEDVTLTSTWNGSLAIMLGLMLCNIYIKGTFLLSGALCYILGEKSTFRGENLLLKWPKLKSGFSPPKVDFPPKCRFFPQKWKSAPFRWRGLRLMYQNKALLLDFPAVKVRRRSGSQVPSSMGLGDTSFSPFISIKQWW